ncbi:MULTISPECIES: helix-turn-helix domain-containing protein [Erwinia]|uniref:Transcriptional regulator n=1 Tax=Erwinia rhapontici TaxID=55212 RepID=A0ABN6DIR1_ERWRD|nr:MULTISPECIES: helix-turn-helix transcriptional regulator [Erwinia]MBP2154569.1 Ner family transcriptional regulator [Erwinia rhapontici]NNS06411.1 helix-turn-helix domain-containing protein [Erwinia sp. JH02]BCQ33768.1 transcriptional regulator [Erwinia rhapontici]BCQ43706.1 transcriptional regulator [Erwinia rhapontici]
MCKKEVEHGWHRADILAAVRKKHHSLAALSRANGLNSSTLANALVRPWAKGEEIIAKAIGVKAQDIWPNRYKNHKGEVIKRLRKNTCEPTH